MKPTTTLLAILAATQSITALKVPQNVRDFYKRVKVGRCEGSDKLKGGFFDKDGKNAKAQGSYCQKSVANQAIFLHGPNTFANMDIDCDGDLSDPGDGRCGSSEDTQGQTAFVDQVRKVSKNKIKDLNANIHPYVVFGNDREDGGPTFDPQKYGVKPLSVMAVVCGEKLIYGIWGDTNGDVGPPLVGEASLSLATACYGTKAVNGNSGHDESDVLYVAFTGEEAVPGPRTKWDAKDFAEFEDSIVEVGNRLIGRLK
ncbi:MAG: hypothetical protein L6R42_005739 [Xanthoria sp. 1 TBL-2021]|nr:MAG: hypothetical protein L6R42_005739 [Xanthoria sp. 1 TBL-2021]